MPRPRRNRIDHRMANTNPTYRELHRNELGWIASHVAGDLLEMNDPNDTVNDLDMAKIIEARKRDAAAGYAPPSLSHLPDDEDL